MSNRVLSAFVLLLSSIGAVAQTPAEKFDGVEKWKGSLTAADIASLKSQYSTEPPANFMAKGQKPTPGISPETDFWQKLLASGMTDFEVNTVEETDQSGLHLVTLAVSMKMKTPDGPRTRYVTEQQAWQKQGDTWRIVVAGHSDVVKMAPALKPNPNLYSKDAVAKAEIEEAVAAAKKGRQRVILVFGANWCYDCHVLDQAFHQADVAPLLEKNFHVVHVDIGDDGKKNNDLAEAYQVPLNKGIPALAVLDADGKVVFAQKNGEWESARSLDPDDIIVFLQKWKP
ncbi:MAG TPA: thioredoxin family protein [Terriglobales bacterium]|nr:thioredoxin family protein [Terriglobales bacterium]